MSPLTADSNDLVYAFDGFTLDPSRRVLARDGDEVALGSRALDLLITLVEQAGEILSRDHLTSRVWPRTVVEESSLRVHMAALRRALGDGQDGRRYVATVPGRGYGFVAAVSRRPRRATTHESAALAPLSQIGKLPALLGREAGLLALTRLLHANRLVTLVGPGGVGKSSLALHWAETVAMPVCVIDLAGVSSEGEVMQRLLDAQEASATQGLLILDNCEHVIDASARFVEALLTERPELRLLVTTREPLHVAGEHVLRLEPLALPVKRPVSLAEALEAPAVRLLAERARATGNDVVFTEADAAALSELARQLDGLPLALELGAARVRALGLKGLLHRVDELNGLLTRGRRTALPRHRSVEANIAWSCGLLDEAERRALAALSVFTARFSLASAAAVVASAPGGEDAGEELVLQLVEKSLVLALPNAAYRLPNTVRRHAAAQLRAEAAETRRVQARHAAVERALATAAGLDAQLWLPSRSFADADQ